MRYKVPSTLLKRRHVEAREESYFTVFATEIRKRNSSRLRFIVRQTIGPEQRHRVLRRVGPQQKLHCQIHPRGLLRMRGGFDLADHKAQPRREKAVLKMG